MSAIDYTKEPWEELDATGRYWGVFACEGYSPDPFAIFTSEETAAEWMAWQATRGDDNALGGCDYTICPIDSVTGNVWNSHDAPPPERT